MQIPSRLQESIDRIVQHAPPTALARARTAMTQKYREGEFSGSVFSDEGMRLAYLAARFPATYAATFKILREIKDRIPAIHCKKVLDLGAGPGTAAWAALDVFPDVEEVSLVERNLGAIALGKELSKALPAPRKEEWFCRDLESKQEIPFADLVLVSYALGELKNPEAVIERIWQGGPSYLVIVEPGTPRGYELILSLRDLLLKSGAHLIAPCPHALRCPLSGRDWCHFSVRVERTKLHRLLKQGALGYEDEKFSYLVVSRIQHSLAPYSRILRHPQKGSGHVRLSLCHADGQKKERVVSRKEKDVYRLARDAEWGDAWM
jgi:ribosomal protein RSM22 (predicted rRNA methylase)